MSIALPSLGFAGIGLMGLPMCRRLLAAGFPLTVWNRSSDKCAPLVAAGASQANSPAELCAAADVVMLCLADTQVVHEVVFGDDGIAAGGAAGQLLVDFSSLEPGATRQMAAQLRQACGMHWLDAPVSGGTPGAGPAAWRSWSAARRPILSGCARCSRCWGSGSRTWVRWGQGR